MLCLQRSAYFLAKLAALLFVRQPTTNFLYPDEKTTAVSRDKDSQSTHPLAAQVS
jgi:hypothetical protein